MASALTHIGATRLATIRPEPTATLRTPASQPSSLTWLPPAGIRHSVSRVSADLVGARPSHGWPHGGNRSARLEVTARAGGARPRPAGARPSQRPPMRRQQQQTEDKDGPLMNSDIRVPTLRLLAETRLWRAAACCGVLGCTGVCWGVLGCAGVCWGVLGCAGMCWGVLLRFHPEVMIAADAKPPVARIMDYSFSTLFPSSTFPSCNFLLAHRPSPPNPFPAPAICLVRHASTCRADIPVKHRHGAITRYNIDTGDYNVRLKQALKFLHDGDKVKLTAQFRGREMEFKELGVKLFEKFQHDVAEHGVGCVAFTCGHTLDHSPSSLCPVAPSLQLAIVESKAHLEGRSLAIVESKAHLEGRSMHMVLAPNKAVLQRMAAAEEKSRRAAERSKRAETRGVVSGSESDGGESGGESDGERRWGGGGGGCEREKWAAIGDVENLGEENETKCIFLEISYNGSFW
ncbi:unnamed protein product [Closterium sp. NIES-65]|nr:unnamed protein product [Closterium sp. NIES-65]